MAWSTVTGSGNGRRNDDLARVLEHGGVLDLLLLDGATSLAERDYVDAVDGDPAWFVRRFADALAAVLASAPLAGDLQGACVGRALAAVQAEWQARGGMEAPLYARPIAAFSWVRVRADGPARHLETWCLGDCKLLLGLGLNGAGGAVRDLDPFDNLDEHALQEAVAGLVAGGVDDAAARFAALTPGLRARREAQMLSDTPQVLCLEPRGPFAARRNSLRLEAEALDAGALLLAMSDGYYRLVDPYAAYDDAGLVHAVAVAGPEALLAELRRFEAGRDTSALSVKGADDATAIALRLVDAPSSAAVDEPAQQAQVERIRRYVAAYNAFDVDAMLAELHPGLRFENHAGGALSLATDGIEAFRDLATRAGTMFAEREQRIVALERQGEALVAVIAWRGRAAVDLPDGPRAGTLVELTGRSEFEFADGRIVRIVDRS